MNCSLTTRKAIRMTHIVPVRLTLILKSRSHLSKQKLVFLTWNIYYCILVSFGQCWWLVICSPQLKAPLDHVILKYFLFQFPPDRAPTAYNWDSCASCCYFSCTFGDFCCANAAATERRDQRGVENDQGNTPRTGKASTGHRCYEEWSASIKCQSAIKDCCRSWQTGAATSLTWDLQPDSMLSLLTFFNLYCPVAVIHVCFFLL